MGRQGHITVGALLVVISLSTSAAAPGTAKANAVRQINAALGLLRDVTCTMYEERGAPDAAGEARHPVTIHLKLSDKARLRTVDEYGNERHTIKNGHTEWRVLVPRTVSKTVWPDGGVPPDSPVPVLQPESYRMMRSAMMSSKGRALRRINYRGIEEAEGVPCHVFVTHEGRTLTWIAVDDGLIRRQARRDDSARHVTRFTDFRINQGLDDALFEYEPPEGARVDVNEYVDGEWRRSQYRVPYAPVPPAQQEEASARLAELLRRFGRAKGFSATLFESYLAHATHAIAADGRRLPVGHVRTGTLTVGPPCRVRFEGERRDVSAPIRRQVLLISDGSSVWMSDRDADEPADRHRTVLRDRLLPAGAWRDRERAEAVLRGQPPEGTDITFQLPAYLLAPLGGMEMSRVRFVGEELVDGERTCRFDVKAAEQDVESTHWIGVADGIPRRIEIRNVPGNAVETTVRITDVQVDPRLSPETFTFENDGTWTVVDMQRWRLEGHLPGLDG